MIAKSSIRKAVSGVLAEFDIDNLALECRIATDVYGFFQRLENGETESLVEADMLSEFERNHAEIKYMAELVERVSASLRLNVKTGGNWDSVLAFIARMEKNKGQTIEKFSEWCKNDPFNSPKAHQIANKPSLIEATWPQAFPEGVQIQMFEQESDGGFDF